MKTIQYAAVNLDGVLLKDTFSPVIYQAITKKGMAYTSEIENHLFSKPRKESAEYIRKLFGIEKPSEEITRSFFEERRKYMNAENSGVIRGSGAFLERMAGMNLKMICYGGMDEKDIHQAFRKYLRYFERYVCTNDFRPGVKEITKDMYGLEYEQILFIDDVNLVAQKAKEYQVPFIGVPADFEWSWQRKAMIETGVKYLVHSLREIDEAMLEAIDREARQGTVWKMEKERAVAPQSPKRSRTVS